MLRPTHVENMSNTILYIVASFKLLSNTKDVCRSAELIKTPRCERYMRKSLEIVQKQQEKYKIHSEINQYIWKDKNILEDFFLVFFFFVKCNKENI